MLTSLVQDSLYVNLQQSHRLVTKEDGQYFHIHKILGITVLGSFIYRIYLFLMIGDMNFNSSFATMMCIAVHAALHISSFQFILPARRNKSYNVIWPEARIHSMVFAYRSLSAMIIIWMQMRAIISTILADRLRIVIIFLTMFAADFTTMSYKNNDTTMRDNPYPTYIPQILRQIQNMFYSVSQVIGTMQIINCRSMDVAFIILLPIQTAPFCMTLVKKGIIKQAGWHFYYTWALLIIYIRSILSVADNQQFVMNDMYIFWKLVAAFCIGRFGMNINKYTLWTIVSSFFLSAI